MPEQGYDDVRMLSRPLVRPGWPVWAVGTVVLAAIARRRDAAGRNMTRWAYNWRLVLSLPLSRTVAGSAPGEFHNWWLSITPSPAGDTVLLRLEAGWKWNGVSVGPDAPGTYDATAFHDACYRYLDVIAAVWGVPISEARKIVDGWFYQISVQDKCPVALLYWCLVRVFGGVYRRGCELRRRLFSCEG